MPRVTQTHPVSRLCTSTVYSEYRRLWFMPYADATKVTPPGCNWPMEHSEMITKITVSKCISRYGRNEITTAKDFPKIPSIKSWVHYETRVGVMQIKLPTLTFFINARATLHRIIIYIAMPLSHARKCDFLHNPEIASRKISIFSIQSYMK